MKGLELIMWSQGQWEASKKTSPDGADRQTDKQTHRQTHGHGDSMTESAQCGRFSENLRGTDLQTDLETIEYLGMFFFFHLFMLLYEWCIWIVLILVTNVLYIHRAPLTKAVETVCFIIYSVTLTAQVSTLYSLNTTLQLTGNCKSLQLQQRKIN